MSSLSDIDSYKYVHTEVVSEEILQKNIDYLRTKNIIIPTFEQLAHPETIPPKIVEELKKIDLWELNPLNLFRISWHNDVKTGGFGSVNTIHIPAELTGLKSSIYILIGKQFPTGCHKVGATFGPLV